MRKGLALILATVLCFTMTGCGNKPASNTTEKVSDPEIETVEKNQLVEDKDQEVEEAVDVNKKLMTVEVTLPASFLGLDEEELDIDQVVKEAKEQGIKDVIINDDKSITYVMSKSKHKEMMDEMQEGITETTEELLSDENFDSYQDIVANKDFTEFDVLVIREKYENSFDGFGILGLAFSSLFYQLFDGANPDNYRAVINIIDEAKGEAFDTIVYPDAFDE